MHGTPLIGLPLLPAAADVEGDHRWVVWNQSTARHLVRRGVRLERAWDLAAVHRLLHGGWRAEPARVWAAAHELPLEDLPTGRVDLFTPAGEGGPLRGDGHLDPTWDPTDRAWAELAVQVAERQVAQLADDRARATARAESAAELLCAELAVDGLPIDRAEAERLLTELIGGRDDASSHRARRDEEVLRHAPLGHHFDLRSPGQVRALLRSVGIEVPDTRAWRLERLRDAHPIVEPLLRWRRAERVATTYGWSWLDEHVGADDRLRGEWSAADGAAGRMTASAGLHNLPADMRRIVAAEPQHVFVRADLGQIEPRVLAAVSGDEALAAATAADDLYAPVATALGVEREVAKVAVLGAMYGSTTGLGAQALHRLHAAFPVAMAYLDEADRAAQVGRDLRTYGGRRVPMGRPQDRAGAAAQGRYGRNAVVQGAAAELFKVWAAIVRARGASFGARIVLCLHDELLVHVHERHGDAAALLVEACLAEAAHRWAPAGSAVRFVADITVVRRWSEAKPLA